MLSAQSDGAKAMPNRFTSAARHSVREARQARADERAADLAPIVAELQAGGVTSLRGIAAALNERGIPIVTGSGHWHHAQVARLLVQLAG
jgi:hypothetical protein